MKTKMKTKMKNILCVLLILTSILNVNAQIKLKSNGRVRIGGGSLVDPSASLEVQENQKTTELRIFATSPNIARIWAMNQIFAYGFGVDASGIGHIYGNVNSEFSIMTFSTTGQIGMLNGSYPWIFGRYSSGDPQMYSASNWGVLGSDNAPLYKIFSNYIWCNGVSVSSDEKLKTNIKKMPDCLKKVRLLNGVHYDYKQFKTDSLSDDKKKELNDFSNNRIGFLAQDLKEIFPELVHYNSKTGYYSVDYIGMIPVLVEALKELQLQVDSMKNTVNKKSSGSLKSAEISTNVESSNIANQAILQQNAPNPFSQTTNIGYYLPETIHNAALYLYDMNGTQIRSIPLTSKGNGSITINGYELHPGMYLYTLIADGQEVSTKRMILTQ